MQERLAGDHDGVQSGWQFWETIERFGSNKASGLLHRKQAGLWAPRNRIGMAAYTSCRLVGTKH